MENFRLLGGSEGTLLVERSGRFYPVCGAMFKRSHQQRLASSICRQLGFGEVLFVGSKEEKDESDEYACDKWENACEKCLDSFLIVGGKCSKEEHDKPSSCSFKYSSQYGQGSCIKGRSELMIKCNVPKNKKRQKHGEWSDWSQCDPTEQFFRHRSRECQKGSICKGHWLEMSPGCRCIEDKVLSTESSFDYYSYESSDSSSIDSSTLEVALDIADKETELFDPSYLDYYSARAPRPQVEKKKYKESFCYDTHLFKRSKRSLLCESSTKSTTTRINKSTSTTATMKPLVEDDLSEISVQLRHPEAPITDESLEQGGFMLGFSFGENTLLIGTISIGFLLLILVAIVYVLRVINKPANKSERIVKLEDKCFISAEVSEDKIDSREEGDVFACQ